MTQKAARNTLCNSLAVLLLALTSSYATADWLSLTGSGDVDVEFYVEPATRRQSGNIVKMWTMADLKTADAVLGKAFLSAKGLVEFDCQNQQVRALDTTYYSGKMGSGRVIHIDSTPDKWAFIPPETLGETSWEVACK